MADPAAASLRRILHLIPELADGEAHPVAAVAARVGVDRATLLRDLREMTERWDDPAGFVEGVRVYLEAESVRLHSSHFLRPMRITVQELAALELGLALLRAERSPEEHRVLQRARERLSNAMAVHPGEQRVRIRLAAGVSAPEGGVLPGIRTALRQRTKVRLTYRGSRDTASQVRTVCPYSLAFASGAWYLVAHCERSSGLRVFRLDRIESTESLEDPFEVPDTFDPAVVMQEGKVLSSPGEERVTIRYSPVVARWVAEREGKPLAADGSLTMEHPLADVRWAVRHVLQYGPEAEVLEPEHVRDAVRAALELALG